MEGDQKGTIPFAKYRVLTEITRQKLMKRTHQFVCSQSEDQTDELSSAKSYQCETSHLMGNTKNADEGDIILNQTHINKIIVTGPFSKVWNKTRTSNSSKNQNSFFFHDMNRSLMIKAHKS